MMHVCMHAYSMLVFKRAKSKMFVYQSDSHRKDVHYRDSLVSAHACTLPVSREAYEFCYNDDHIPEVYICNKVLPSEQREPSMN